MPKYCKNNCNKEFKIILYLKKIKEIMSINISLIKKVENAINDIRPYLISDGGDIKVVSIDNKNFVNIEFVGNCKECPISPMTLKSGIEESIKNNVPEIEGVNDINFSN